MTYTFRHIQFFKQLFGTIAVAIALLGMGNNSCLAQLGEPQPNFHNYTVKDGLPATETYFVHQDKTGYIWIATDHGVSRFDGYKFENFSISDGLTDNVIFKIYEDYKGRIWFVTYNSMLCYYENGKIHPYKYNHLIEKSMTIAKVVTQKMIYIDKNDKLYYSINYNGMFSIDKKGKVTVHNQCKNILLQKIDGHAMWSFYHPNYGIEVIKSKIQYFDGKQFRFFGDVIGNERWSLVNVGGKDFFMCDNVIYPFDSEKKLLEEKDAICTYNGKNNNHLWVGTFKHGVVEIPDIYHPGQKSRYLDNLSVTSVLCDKEGGYWFTTLEKGIFYTPSLHIKNYTMQQGLIDDDVFSIAGIKDEIYMGFLLGRWQNLKNTNKNLIAKGNTFSEFGVSKNKFYVSYIQTPMLKKLHENLFQTLWTADYYTEKKGSVLFGAKEVYRVYDNGKIEILYSYLKDKGPQKKNLYQTLMSDKNGTIWVGCLPGLFYIDDQRNMSINGLNDPLFKVRVSDLVNDDTWKNVVATRGEGIYFFDNKKIFKQVKAKNGLLSDIVNCMFIDEAGGLWVGTNKGLNYITKNQKGQLKIEDYTSLHGLISDEISSIYVYNGLVYAATKGGLSVIDTKAFVRNKHLSDIYVTQLETTNRKVNPLVHNIFGHKESYIKIGFRNSNYRTLKNGAFEYRFDKQSDWISTTVPEITLINPLPGEYNLEIRYRNEDGLWSAPQLVSSFTIDTAFYNKWYFFAGIAVLMALIGWWLFRMRIRQLQQRHKISNKINQLEQKALQAQMNPHFIFNALNSIQSFLVYEENDKAEKYLLKFAQLIRQTLVNSRELYITIENEIGILEKYLDLERMRFKDKFTYRIESELPASDLALKIPNMLIQPFVENAVLHGFSTLDSGGRITVTFRSVDANQILCIIEDNGIGRKKALAQSSKKHVSFGTTITEERLKAFETKHGVHLKIETIDIENPDGKTGTKVLINLPLISEKENG